MTTDNTAAANETTGRNVPGTDVTWAQVNATAARVGDVSLADAIRITVADKEAGHVAPAPAPDRDAQVAAAAAEIAAYIAKR